MDLVDSACAVGIIRNIPEFSHIFERIIFRPYGADKIMTLNDGLNKTFAEIAFRLRSSPELYFEPKDFEPEDRK